MKKYCVVMGTDRISSEQDVQILKRAGLLGDSTNILDLHINLGDKKAIEAQASNLAYESQYSQLARREWESKGVNPENVILGKLSTPDGALFIVATY